MGEFGWVPCGRGWDAMLGRVVVGEEGVVSRCRGGMAGCSWLGWVLSGGGNGLGTCRWRH